MKKLLFIFLLLTFYSCKQSDTNNTLTYFGGQIINPKVDYVFLVKDGVTVDSTLLDDANKFLLQFKLEKEGLYLFKHGNEFQYLYLEPADSVLVRLNTWDFDESIVFTGRGAEKNNFLINLFIINELEDQNFYPFYNYDAETFEKKIDSTIASKEKILTKFKNSNHNISDGFLKLAKAGIYLPTYRKKENYAYGHKKLLNLPDYKINNKRFYDYRKQVNLNDTSLIYYHSYQNYFNSLVYNKASLLKENDTLNQSFSLIALKVIAEQATHNKIKDMLLKQTLMESFLRNAPCRFDDAELEFFNNNSNNLKDIARISKLNDDANSLKENELLTDFAIIDTNKQLNYIKQVAKNHNTVIYFWSPDSMSDEYLVARIRFLETSFPSVLFIGINTDSSDPSIKKSTALPIKNMYFLPDNSLGKIHISSNFPRTILINKDGVIVNCFTFLGSRDFNQQVADLEKY